MQSYLPKKTNKFNKYEKKFISYILYFFIRSHILYYIIEFAHEKLTGSFEKINLYKKNFFYALLVQDAIIAWGLISSIVQKVCKIFQIDTRRRNTYVKSHSKNIFQHERILLNLV